MKRILIGIVGFAFAMLAMADTVYPYTNPTYIPTAISPAQSFSAPGEYTVTNNGLGTVAFQVTGTCTSLAANPQVTANGSVWVTVPAVPGASGAAVTSVSATGLWRVNASGMQKVRLHITALTAACSISASGTPNGSYGASSIDQTTDGTTNLVATHQLATSGDPCSNPSLLKSSVAVAQSASTTAALVAAVAAKTTYICSFNGSAVGTNPTMTLKTGTQASTACDTGAANLSGALIPAVADGMFQLSPGHTLASSAVAGQVCLTTGATTSIQGILTYVQQ